MEKKKKNLLTGALVAGAIITGSALNMNVANAFSFRTLGSGSDLRANLLKTDTNPDLLFELKCGEKKADTTNQKVKDAKCGEGKCGDEKTIIKSDTSNTETSNESKTKDAKCGEGKCGE